MIQVKPIHHKYIHKGLIISMSTKDQIFYVKTPADAPKWGNQLFYVHLANEQTSISGCARVANFYLINSAWHKTQA